MQVYFDGHVVPDAGDLAFKSVSQIRALFSDILTSLGSYQNVLEYDGSGSASVDLSGSYDVDTILFLMGASGFEVLADGDTLRSTLGALNFPDYDNFVIDFGFRIASDML